MNADTVIEKVPTRVAEPATLGDGMDEVPKLMLRIQNREQKAMAELYILCHTKVLRTVSFLIKDDHAARDITQDVFLRIWRYASAYDPDKSINAMAWINQVARNQVLTDMARRKKRHECGDGEIDQIAAESTDSEQVARITTQSPAFEAALDGLNPSIKKVILLRFFCEKSLAEIASEMNIPLGTVKTWLHRGLARMKTQLESNKLEFNDVKQ